MNRDLRSDVERLRAGNAELRDELDTLRGFLDTLQELVEALDQPRSDGEVFGALAASLEGALGVLNAAGGALLVLDEDTDELVLVLRGGEDESEPWQRQPAERGLVGWVLRRREPLITNDASSDERFEAGADQPAGHRTESALMVPVEGHDRVLGVFRIVNKRESSLFTEDDQTLVSLMGRFAGELLLRMARRQERSPSG